VALNWTKALEGLRNIGILLYGLAAALAYLPIFDSPFYTPYELSNYARFTGISISLSDITFVFALVLTLFTTIILDLTKVLLTKQQTLILVAILFPLGVSIGNNPELATLARVLRLVIYTTLPLLLLNNKKDLRMFALGYISLTVPQLAAVLGQRLDGAQMIGLTLNPNLVASYGLTSLIIWIYAWFPANYRTKSIKVIILQILPVILASFLIVLPVSRGSIIAVLSLLIVLVVIYRGGLTRFTLILQVAGPALVVVIIVITTGPRLDHLIRSHSFEEATLIGKVDSFTSGRVSSTQRHIDKITEDGVWTKGYGAGRYTEATGKAPPNNLYLTTIGELGVILAILYLSAFIALVILRPQLILPLAILGLVSYLTHSAEGTLITYTLIGVAIASLTYITETSSTIVKHIHKETKVPTSQESTI